MATALQLERLRSDIGATDSTLPNDEADDLFVEAAEAYSDTNTMIAYTRVLAIRRLLASSAKLVDYAANQSQEKQSQVFAHLKQLLAFWQDEVATADEIATAAAAGSSARFGGLRRKPSRLKEYPDA